jgi:hypothetical protein
MEEDRRSAPFNSPASSFKPIIAPEALLKTCSQRPATLWQGQALGYAQTGAPFNITDVEAPEHHAFCQWLSKEFRYSLALDAHNVQQFRKAAVEVPVL